MISTNDLLRRYRCRTLDPAARDKPLDFGGGGITVSVNGDGRITAINAYHPVHGYVTLTSADPFPEAERYNPAAVRAYRAGLVWQDGFGLRFEQPIVRREAWLIEDAVPHLRLTLANGASAEVTTFVPLERPVGVLQCWRFSEAGCFARLSGRFSLQRCAYTQLTEGGPIPAPPIRAEMFYRRPGAFGVKNPALGWAVLVNGDGVARADGTVEFAQDAMSLQEANLVFVPGLDPGEAQARFHDLQQDHAERLLLPTLDAWHARWTGWSLDDHPLDALLRRGQVYGLLCAVPVGDEATCILTDHQLLPLSWNRDSYYTARALLDWQAANGPEIVRRHLIWLFEAAEHPAGFWGRSYLANGRVKDPAFQLDQQLFPLLELAEYTAETGEQDTFARLRGHIRPIVEMLLARQDAISGLFPTDETPADDPVALPYHLSSHILLWYTLRRIAPLVQDVALAALAEHVRTAVWRHFVVEKSGRRLFAYLTDGRGRHYCYHDANDLPLALAPAWGFCPADDPIWRATMVFAFSPENEGGYYAGPLGGLGSVHTPAPWPLGDVQEGLFAALTDDPARQESVIRRLRAVTQWDGALPEAYDAITGGVISRHWFAWPGSALPLLIPAARRAG